MELLGVTLRFDWNCLHFCLKLWKYVFFNHPAPHIRCGIENQYFRNNEIPITGCILYPKRSDQNDSKVQILSAVYVFQKMIQATVPCDIALKENARIEQKDNILVKILEYLGYFGSVAWWNTFCNFIQKCTFMILHLWAASKWYKIVIFCRILDEISSFRTIKTSVTRCNFTKSAKSMMFLFWFQERYLTKRLKTS